MNINEKIHLLEKRSKYLYPRLEKCDICPRNCMINRLKDELGYCKAGKDIVVYTAFLHQGEEPGISAKKGSGTIFFSGCNLRCSFCQNFEFSKKLVGTKVSKEELADIFLRLQKKEAANINLVTPNHFLAQILSALLIAFNKGLNLPIVYNTSGYDKQEIIDDLKGIVDIYLTDFKYINPKTAKKYSNAIDYPKRSLDSLITMNRQVKTIWNNDTLKQGLIIRHLVLPGLIDDSKKILKLIKDKCPQGLVSVMFQYFPYHKAKEHPEINRQLTIDEYKAICKYVQEINLQGWVQKFDPAEDLAGVHFKQGIEGV